MTRPRETADQFAERCRRLERRRPVREPREDSPAMKAALAAMAGAGERAAKEIIEIQASVGVTADRPLFGRYGEGR